MPLAIYENPEMFNKLKLSLQEAPNRCSLLIEVISGVLRSFIGLMGVAGIVFEFDPLIFVMLLTFMFPILSLRNAVSSQWHNIYVQQIPNQRMKDHLVSLLLDFKNIAELKFFTAIVYIKSKIITTLQQQYSITDRKRKHAFVVESIALLVSTGCAFVIKIWVLWKAVSKKQTIGKVLQLINAVDTLQRAFQVILSQASSAFEQILYINTLYDLLEVEHLSVGSAGTVNESIKVIRLENVSFTYPGAKYPALKNITMCLQIGKCYAFVGRNGSGKSTLVKLLMGLYQPTEGKIYINDKDIKSWDKVSLKTQISAVFQDYIRYPFSIEQNIALGREETCTGCNPVEIASEKAMVGEFVRSLPKKYETILGKEWPNGIELSGGQWQRIAIARALFSQSRMLILDEPFSSIDGSTKKIILKNLLKEKKDKITVLISHREEDFEKCDWIVVIDRGMIVTQNTYGVIKNEREFSEVLKING